MLSGVQRSAEATKIEQTFRSAVKGNTHAIEQINDRRGRLAHGLDRRLVGEEIAAVNVSSKCCQVESPSPFRFFAALIPPCAHTECDRFTGTMEKRSTCAAHFGDLDDRRQSGQAAANNDNLWS